MAMLSPRSLVPPVSEGVCHRIRGVETVVDDIEDRLREVSPRQTAPSVNPAIHSAWALRPTTDMAAAPDQDREHTLRQIFDLCNPTGDGLSKTELIKLCSTDSSVLKFFGFSSVLEASQYFENMDRYQNRLLSWPEFQDFVARRFSQCGSSNASSSPATVALSGGAFASPLSSTVGSNYEAQQAVSEYARQLRSWVEQRVDDSMWHKFKSFEERHECLGGQMSKTAENQSILLSVVQSLSEEVTKIKVAMCQGGVAQTLDDEMLRAMKEEHDRVLGVHRAELWDHMSRRLEDAQDEARQRYQHLVKQFESNIADCYQELTSEVAEQLRGYGDVSRKVEERLNERFDTLGSSVGQQLEERLSERAEALGNSVNRQIEDLLAERFETLQHIVDRQLEERLNGRLAEFRDELESTLQNGADDKPRAGQATATQQKLVAELRAEMIAAFRSEAAALSALDEQLWLTDKRLQQRIDELWLLHSRDTCRESAPSPFMGSTSASGDELAHASIPGTRKGAGGTPQRSGPGG